MTGSEHEALQRRMAALEQEQFAVLEQLRRLGDATERNANALDALEDVLTEVSWTPIDDGGDALAEAIAQRQHQLNLTDTSAAPPPPAGPEEAASATAGGVELPDLEQVAAWVQTHIAPMVRKTTTTGEGGGIRWCRQWWHHSEAVDRFTALYLAWQELSAEDSSTWLSVFLRDHLDPHMATLTSPFGPFYACHPRRHSGAIEALETDQPTPPDRENAS